MGEEVLRDGSLSLSLSPFISLSLFFSRGRDVTTTEAPGLSGILKMVMRKLGKERQRERKERLAASEWGRGWTRRSRERLAQKVRKGEKGRE